MEPTVEKITLVEDARFDSPKSMFLGRVMGNYTTYQTLLKVFSILLDADMISYEVDAILLFISSFRGWRH